MNVKKCRNCKHFYDLYFDDGKKAGIGLCRFPGLMKRRAATSGTVPTKCEHFEFDEERWKEFDREKRRDRECQRENLGGTM